MHDYYVGIDKAKTPSIYIRNAQYPVATARWYISEESVEALIWALNQALEALRGEIEWPVNAQSRAKRMMENLRP